MKVVQEAAEILYGALRTVPGVRAYRLGEAPATNPALVLAMPVLAWSSAGDEPTEGTWAVALIVDANERAPQVLWELLPQVVEVLDSLIDVSVLRAEPAVFIDGSTPLPCYEIMLGVTF